MPAFIRNTDAHSGMPLLTVDSESRPITLLPTLSRRLRFCREIPHGPGLSDPLRFELLQCKGKGGGRNSMHMPKHNHHGLEYLNLQTDHQRYSLSPGHARRDRLFWAGATLMLVIMLLYVMRGALDGIRVRPQLTVSNAVAR